ncbi:MULTISPECIES: hypothetical protein [Spirulina sp. CCY15215]|uniref:helix-turn-helix domain-containing protein n=1 Tax=Spirulina sp. CCY15215 TaxID=2767591 RepID=UPI001952544B|nr:hypothetical protein [Spirulina major]
MKKTTNAIKIINNLIKDEKETQQRIAESYLNTQIGQLIYDARQQSEFTQKQLANILGVEESVIDDLEIGDYEGDGLIMLQKIARVINCNLQIELSSNNSNSSLKITV